MKKKTEIKKLKRYLRCQLTKEELLMAGKTHADKQLELVRLENDRKRVADEFKAKISALEAETGALANTISTGYEYRNVNCTAYIGEPTPEKKRIIRDDTNEQVAIEDLTQEELQKELISEE